MLMKFIMAPNRSNAIPNVLRLAVGPLVLSPRRATARHTTGFELIQEGNCYVGEVHISAEAGERPKSVKINRID